MPKYDGTTDPDGRLDRFWEDLQRGTSPPPVDVAPDLAATIRYLHAHDDTPGPDAATADRIWHGLLQGEAGATPHRSRPELNGRVPLGSRQERALSPRRAPHVSAGGRSIAAGVGNALRTAGIGVLAGMVAGLGAGFAARVAMRISALMAGAGQRGAFTDNGERVGEIGLDGTLFLVLSGMMAGVFVGTVYVAVKPWLPWAGWRRGLLFGLLLLATIGGVAMQDGTNPDYRRFGVAAVNVGLVVLVLVLFGLLLAPLADRLDRVVPAWSPRWPARRRDIAFGAAVSVTGLLGLGAILLILGLRDSVTGVDGPLDWLGYVRLQVVIVAVVVRLVVARVVGRFDRPADLARHPAAAAVAYGALALPVLAGLVLTVRAINLIV